LYALSDIVRLTGSKTRSCQLWADAGAIQADPATMREGPGVHRSFSKDEVIIACVLAAFALDKAPIGRLVRVGGSVRSMLRDGHWRTKIYSAIHGGEKVYLISDQRNTSIYVADTATLFFSSPTLMGAIAAVPASEPHRIVEMIARQRWEEGPWEFQNEYLAAGEGSDNSETGGLDIIISTTMDRTYLPRMSADNPKANLVFLNGALARLRGEAEFPNV
jgi:hypothetical protein